MIDASNPLDHSRGFPPSLFVSNTDSLAEQLQEALPEIRLVKMFNTMAHEVMMYIPLWLRIYGAVGRPLFNIKVVR